MLRRIADAHSTAKVVPSLDVQSLLAFSTGRNQECCPAKGDQHGFRGEYHLRFGMD